MLQFNVLDNVITYPPDVAAEDLEDDDHADLVDGVGIQDIGGAAVSSGLAQFETQSHVENWRVETLHSFIAQFESKTRVKDWRVEQLNAFNCSWKHPVSLSALT